MDKIKGINKVVVFLPDGEYDAVMNGWELEIISDIAENVLIETTYFMGAPQIAVTVEVIDGVVNLIAD